MKAFTNKLETAEVIRLRRKEPNTESGHSQYRIAYGGMSRDAYILQTIIGTHDFDSRPAQTPWWSLFVEGEEGLGCVFSTDSWESILEKYEYVQHLYVSKDAVIDSSRLEQALL